MKVFKKISVFVIAFMFMFVGLAPAYALDVVDEGIIKDNNNQTFFVPTTPGDTSYNWVGLRTSDGKVAYCYDLDRTWPSDGDGTDYSETIDQMDVGVIYILEHGANDPVNPSNQERWVTQGAIWLYRTGEDNFVTPYTDTYNLLPKMRELVQGAKAAKASGNVDSGTIGDITVSSSEMVLSGDYYVSSDITPSVKGASTYSVSVSGVTGAEVIDGPTFNAGSSFKVRVPKTAAVGETVKVTVSIQTKAHIINPSNNGYQRVVSLSSTTRTVSKEINLTTAMPKVCVDYKIVGSVKPDASLTDPTPDKKCFDKGVNYNQEKELTTKTDCKFKGWFTKDELTGKWTDGTALNNDMTLYGAWECPQTVDVPATAASTSFIIVGIGLVLVAGGAGYYVFKQKKQNS